MRADPPPLRPAHLFRLAPLCLLLATCGKPLPEARTDPMVGACQVQRCVCAPTGWTKFTAGGEHPVLWYPDGTPTCAEGLRLQRADRGP